MYVQATGAEKSHLLSPFFLFRRICYHKDMAEEITKLKFKILLVEDDLFMVDLLTKELSAFNYEVEIAKTGVEGVEKFRSFKPDLILLDILLPDQNGLETLRQIRREPEGRQTKAMILSNLGETTDIEEAKRLEVIDYMVKANFSLTEVVEKIRRVLSG